LNFFLAAIVRLIWLIFMVVFVRLGIIGWFADCSRARLQEAGLLGHPDPKHPLYQWATGTLKLFQITCVTHPGAPGDCRPALAGFRGWSQFPDVKLLS
jgi:hypothetical protein